MRKRNKKTIEALHREMIEKGNAAMQAMMEKAKARAARRLEKKSAESSAA